MPDAYLGGTVAPSAGPAPANPAPAPSGPGSLPATDLVIHLQECIRIGREYRDRFRAVWEEVEQQIRCQHPSDWAKKDDWQTKIFIPLQAKKEETAVSYLKKMVFGKGRFFDLSANDPKDEDTVQAAADLIALLLERGDFDRQNDFVITEAVGSPGSGFMKTIRGPAGLPQYIWRSPYHILLDPDGGHLLSKHRFIIDEYRRDIVDVIKQARTKGSPYYEGRDQLDAFLQVAAGEAKQLQDHASAARTTPEAMTVVRGIDGTTSLTLPARYKQVDLHECSVQVPSKDGASYEWRFCVLIDQQALVRDVANPYGCHPYDGARTKPRKYDWYGRGYLENGRGFQELSNSMICLGFDSAKISAMDIIVIDDNKVKDSTSIKYKPLAVWKMKDINAVRIQRQPVSAITDVIRGLQLIDQLDQDASGITRGAQGAAPITGSGSGSNTLGEYERQLALIDQRFLDQGRFLEHDYIVPFILRQLRIILNPALFTQAQADELLGTKTIDKVEMIMVAGPDGAPTQQPKVTGTQEIPRLDLKALRALGDGGLNVKAVGITQFSDRLETIAKMKEGLMAALANPTLTALTKVDVLWKKIWQLSEIEDYDEFLRTKDEVKQMLQQQATPPMPGPGGGPPVPAQLPQPAGNSGGM